MNACAGVAPPSSPSSSAAPDNTPVASALDVSKERRASGGGRAGWGLVVLHASIAALSSMTGDFWGRSGGQADAGRFTIC